MQTSSLYQTRRAYTHPKKYVILNAVKDLLLALNYVLLSAAKDLLLACCCTLLLAPSIPAQTLARPGWAGSGITVDPWWRNAVFYRIDTIAFQDSDGDGRGDLAGITQRLGYLQSLGVDAIIISPPESPDAFSDLVRDASRSHIRIVIELPVSSQIVSNARSWLARGAAGISVAGAFRSPADEAEAHLHELRAVINSFPGERVLLSRAFGKGAVTESDAAQLVGQVIDLPKFFFTERVHNSLWDAPRAPLPTGSSPLLQIGNTSVADMFGDDTPWGLGMQKIVAARLLISPGATAFDWGQELGLRSPVEEVVKMSMQWTPSNITPPKVKVVAQEPAPPTPPVDPNVYGAFKPYVAPQPVPRPIPAGALPDPNALPGFTSGKTFADPSPNGATANVAVEDAEPNSMLNFYRRLIQLRHDNPSVRRGAQVTLNHDAENALVWVRRTPAGSTTAGNVVVTCNLNDKPLTLSLDQDLANLHIRPGTLRPLLGSWTATPISQYSNHITLPPYGVFIGELR